MKMIINTAITAFLLASVCYLPPGKASAHPKEEIKGSLVIAGGSLGSSNKDIYESFIKLAGGSKKRKSVLFRLLAEV